MSENPDELRVQLDTIEQEYNGLLAELQAIVEEKGDASSDDPDYIQKYERAQSLNAQFEALQAKLIDLETAAPVPAAVPEDQSLETQESPDTSSPVMELDRESGVASTPLLAESIPESGEESTASEGEIVQEAPPAEEAAPPEPKYVTVERTRIELETIHEQTWSFVGIVSVSQAVSDLSSKGGYVSENVLQKKFGNITLLCPFEVDFPIGVLMSQFIKKVGPKVGLIYYPQETPSTQSNAILNQLFQQFLASGAPKGHVVAYLKINKVALDDKISLIIGGLTDQDAKIKQNLVKKLGNNVYFDNYIFFKGQMLDDVKSMATKLGKKLITIVGTSNIFQNFDKLQNLVEAF
ncbi:MAG TPA: hypothetical protein VKM55_20990 [Candidatus Lokiarchaeia archaeon]|nr:hypothetical protein [Candidatus Lokiarchaeia archaeon]